MFNPQGHMSDTANRLLVENPGAELIVHKVTYTEVGIVAEEVSITMAASPNAASVSLHESFLTPEILNPKPSEVTASDLENAISEFFATATPSEFDIAPRVATFEAAEPSLINGIMPEVFKAENLAEILEPEALLTEIPSLETFKQDLTQASFADTIFTDSSYEKLISIVDNLESADLVLVPNAEKAAFIADLMDLLGINIKRIIIPAGIEIPPALYEKAIVVGQQAAITPVEQSKKENFKSDFKQIESEPIDYRQTITQIIDQNRNDIFSDLQIPKAAEIAAEELVISNPKPATFSNLQQQEAPNLSFVSYEINPLAEFSFGTNTQRAALENTSADASRESLLRDFMQQEAVGIKSAIEAPSSNFRQEAIDDILNESLFENLVTQAIPQANEVGDKSQDNAAAIPRSRAQENPEALESPKSQTVPTKAASQKQPKAKAAQTLELDPNAKKLAGFLKELGIVRSDKLHSKILSA